MNSNSAGVVVAALLAGLLGGVVADVGMHTFRKAPRPMTINAVNTPTTAKAIERRARATWPELEQSQVDGLTDALRKLTKRPVTILCRDRADCGDLALDLENAFESARWDVKIDAPLVDDTVGVASNDPELAAVVARATSLQVGLVPRLDHHPVFVVLGRRR